MSTRSKILLRTFRDGRTMHGFVFGLGNQRCANGFGLLEIGESGALPGNNVSARRASYDPDRATTIHPKTPCRVRQTRLVNLAAWVVALIQNDGLICLRNYHTVPVLVQRVNMRR